jgi:cellulose synthase/poly-beta-1,6-N-acetylglucosamine synthase-like glycosyltransferase
MSRLRLNALPGRPEAGAGRAPPNRLDRAELARLGALCCLHLGIAPLAGTPPRCAVVDPAALDRVPWPGGRPDPVPVPLPELRRLLTEGAGADLARAAETLRPAATSCRTLETPSGRGLLCVLALAVPGALLAPVHALLLALAVILVFLVAKTALTVAFYLTSAGRGVTGGPGAAATIGDVPGPLPDILPRVTLMVPLLREAEVAETLVRHLGALRYPEGRLDILLIVEDDDHMTQACVAGAALTAAMRVVIVPRGTLRTKPRALNYALALSEGEVIGIYDAEDRPDPDQLLKMARCFAAGTPDLACVQGRLDFYNPTSTWVTRQFTLDYTVWYRAVLPGLARLGMPVPLGGTTLFIRRAVVEEMGGWDAHNVTEDADLGFRLHMAGYRTALMDSVTFEEATSRAWPWIRQRTRWQLGYFMTWRALMNDHRALRQGCGPLGLGVFHILVLGPLLSAFTLPVTLGFGALMVTNPDPILAVAGGVASWGAIVVTSLAELIRLAITLAVTRDRRWLWVSLPLGYAYTVMGAVATLRAVWQMGRNPFFWDKTQHGHG